LVVNEPVVGRRPTGSVSPAELDGGIVADLSGRIARFATSSNNTVLVSGAGSLWTNSSSLYLGRFGSSNQLSILDGGKVVDTVGMIGYYASSSSNTVLVSGAGSLWSNRTLYVGAYGSSNLLSILNGGVVANGGGYIGRYASSSNNTVLVSGAGSLWTNSALYVGYSGSFHRLSIADSGSVRATNVIMGVGESTGNAINVSGGSLLVTNASANGWMEVRRGTLTLNSGTITTDSLIATNGAASVVSFNGGLLQSGGTTISNGVPFTVGDSTSAATLDLLGGTHIFADGLMISTNSSLIGNGGIFGGVTNFNIIAPGHSVGAIDITGGLTLMDTSELDMEIAGTGSNDQLDISGLLKAGGWLNVTFINSYTGNVGDTFGLLNFGSLDGAFSQTNLPALGSGLSWNTSKLYTQGEIFIVPEPGAWALTLAGAGALWLRRRRR
jgi:T5SS/PEP-CTERM-associated repeat protein